jgi:pyruvate formate lyase activating enzyme
MADAEAHRQYTGVSNELIRENLLRIDARGVPLEIRVPVIPGINDSRPGMEASGRFLSGLRNLTGIVLLPYHGLGETKYPRVGRTYKLDGLASPLRERMEETAGWLTGMGLPARTR